MIMSATSFGVAGLTTGIPPSQSTIIFSRPRSSCLLPRPFARRMQSRLLFQFSQAIPKDRVLKLRQLIERAFSKGSDICIKIQVSWFTFG